MPGDTITETALVDAIHLQLATWTGWTLGVRPPQQPTSLTDLAALIRLVRNLAEDAWGDLDDDRSIRGIAHLMNADIDCTRAAAGHGPAHLLSALTSLITATHALT
ncbi:hypothetical protein AB0G73_14175 [Streptomyces sp. NPDC020719]|uniref:hypothetical protein n=1 Tax=Streptomyces sp. NPDC020719 TaxID=3154896 RepID=UPI0033EB5DCB